MTSPRPNYPDVELSTGSDDPLQRIRALTVNVGGIRSPEIGRTNPGSPQGSGVATLVKETNPIMAMEKFVQSHLTNGSAR